YVDAYVGPPELRARAEAGSRWPAPALVREADRLREALETGEYPSRRRAYLHKQLEGIQTTCRALAGERLPYREEVRRCFDIEPALLGEDVFEAAIEELQTLLPGNGPVRERMVAWRERFAVPAATAKALIEPVMAELRRRTQALYPLPAGERVEVRLVTDQPWSGYNWYRGGYASVVDINTDLPVQAERLTGLLAHEAYPGHHTEHCLKEAGLYQQGGWAEHSIFLVSTPEAVIAEGIANTAAHVIFAPGEMYDWQAATLYPLAGLEGDPKRERRIAEAAAALAGVSGNAALLLHEQGLPEREVLAYVMRYGLRNEEQARQSLRFIANPLWRSYIFTYFYGEQLMREWIGRGDRVERFGRLLREQFYPSLLERWVLEERAACGAGQ
ncbi:MAG TPA: hypothetical protein VGE07_11695, partial [Herpetosiphonaceae bacterium]